MAKYGTLYMKLIQSKDWRELREQVLREQRGLCKWCMDRYGWVVPAEVVDHIIEFESGKTEAEQRRLMFSRSNVVGICKQCHSAYHNGQGYHSTAKVIKRQQERQASWEDQMMKRFNNKKQDEEL